MTIRLKLILFISLLFIVAIGNSLLSFKLEEYSEEKLEWVNHTNRVIIETGHFLNAIQDAETGQRGFLLTGDSDYLEPYSDGLASSKEHYIHLIELDSDDPEQLKRLQKIEKIMKLKFDELEETIKLAKDGNYNKALQIVKKNNGKRYMDEI